jgi:predicted RND superfamily exporter protein
MLKTVVVTVVTACSRFSWLVVIIAAIVTAGAAEYARKNFAISTDTSQLISAKLPWRQREIQFDAAFPQQSDTIVVVVDAETPEHADSAA